MLAFQLVVINAMIGNYSSLDISNLMMCAALVARQYSDICAALVLHCQIIVMRHVSMLGLAERLSRRVVVRASETYQKNTFQQRTNTYKWINKQKINPHQMQPTTRTTMHGIATKAFAIFRNL